MSNNKKPENTATAAASLELASEVIKRKIQSEISPKNDAFVVHGKGGTPQCFRAEFVFQVNLRRYLSLQGMAAGGKRPLSNIITFTSAGSDVDVWAVPANMYVSKAWGHDGTRILQMVDNAIGCNEIRAFGTTLTNGCQVSIIAHKDHLVLNIRGRRAFFAKIIEQICWLVSGAGNTPSARLANYLKETKSGKTTRGYAETIYTGMPIVKAEHGHRFNVSFGPPRTEKQYNRDFVAKSGHCWKTLTGLSIVASGFAIPSRPREALGLEAPLFVLRQLLRRGCPGQCLLPADEPMVMFPPVRVEKGYNVRLIFAAGSETPGQGSAIYWHFDPAKFCDSEESYQRLETKIRINSQAIRPNSRHFVGWSSEAGFSLAPSGNTDGVVYSILRPRPHYELVVPAINASLRIPQVGSVGASLATEKVTTTADTQKMMESLPDGFATVSARLFVVWDTDGGRGWLVHGDIVALHLLRAYLQTIPEPRLDFNSLNGVNGDSVSPSEVLNDKENLERVYWPPLKDGDDKPESSNNGKSAGGKSKLEDRIIAEAISGIYATLKEMSGSTLPLNARNGLSAPVAKWVDKKWSTTVKGWDFYDIVNREVARVYVHKLGKNPGWLNMARELDATFLFANGIGEILTPRVGSCCPHFRTLPERHNFLAASMRDLEKVVVKYGGQGDGDKTVARVSRDQVWERRLHPFQRPGCQGEHSDKLAPTCFPVQGLLHSPISYDVQKRGEKDMKLLQDKNVYTKGEILQMAKDNPDGVVVFGRQPGVKELKEIYRRCRQKSSSGTQQGKNAAPTAVQPSDRPSSRGSTKVSNGLSPAAGSTITAKSTAHSSGVGATGSSSATTASQTETTIQKLRTGLQQRTPSMSSEKSTASIPASNATGTLNNRTGQASTTSAHRAPSISSFKSTASNTQPKAPGTVPGAGQSETTTPRSSAASVHKATSHASLRSNGSSTLPQATSAGSVQSHASPAQTTMPNATKKSSNSSMRTTGSITQAPTTQPPTLALKKTDTNSSDKTTSSRSSKSTHNSAAGTAVVNDRQRQQRLEQLGATTAAAGNLAPGQPTENPHSISSGAVPTAGRGSEGS